MDTKSSSLDDDGFGQAYPQQPPSARRRRVSAHLQDMSMRRRLFYALCATLTAWFILHTASASYHSSCRRLPAQQRPADRPNAETKLAVNINKKNATKIALEAHIMSKCPDAKACLSKLVVPSMVEIADKVDFRLSYIGSVDPSSDALSCKHGPPECLGNIILLCAAHLYPSPKLSLGFANCMLADYPDIPDRSLVESCALEHGLSFSKINDCISDDNAHGVNLLHDSILRSERYNVTRSCTVRLAGKVRCIRDGDEWKDCKGGSGVEDLVRDVKDLYNGANGA